MALPGLPYVVLDANQLLVPGTVGPLLADFEARRVPIALPWVHVYEQTKGSAEWWDKVHDLLRANPRAVFFPKPSFALIHEERRRHRVPRGLRAVEDRRNTTALRAYLRDPRPTSDISDVRSAVLGIFHKFHVDKWRETLVKSVTVDNPDEERAIRRGLQTQDRGPLREAVIGYFRLGRLERQLRSLLEANGRSHREVARLCRFPSMSALNVLAVMCFGLRTRFETPKAQPEENSACDIESVLTALYGRGLITADRLARELDEDLRIISRSIWPHVR